MEMTDVQAGQKLIQSFFDESIGAFGRTLYHSSIASPLKEYTDYQSFYKAIGGDDAAWAIGQAAIELSSYAGLMEKDIEEAGIRLSAENNGEFNISKANSILKDEATSGLFSSLLTLSRSVTGTVSIIATKSPETLINESAMPDVAKNVATGVIDAGQSALSAISFLGSNLKYIMWTAVAGGVLIAALNAKRLAKLIPSR